MPPAVAIVAWLLGLALVLLSPASATKPTPGDPAGPRSYRVSVPMLAAGDPVTPLVEAAVVTRPDRQLSLPLVAWGAVTDRFGAPREKGHPHTGIDFGLADFAGSPVLAACAGTVTAASYDDGYGNFVTVDCGDGIVTLYGHLSLAIAVPGQRTLAGTVLGISGSTGVSTGEHLHFEVRVHGVPVDPELYLDLAGLPPKPIEPEPTPTDTPTPEPTPEPTATPTPTPSPTPTGTPTPTPTPSPTPVPRPTPGEDIPVSPRQGAATDPYQTTSTP